MNHGAPNPAEFDTPSDELSLARNLEWIRALSRRLCADAGLADDAAQETALTWMRKPPGDGVPVRGWLRRVLENRLRHGRRASARSNRREREAARPERTSSTSDLVIRASLQRQVMDVVLELNEPARETILLRYFEGLTPAKIAKRMDVPVETVKTRLKRAHARLRDRLDSEHGGDRRAWVTALGTHVLPGSGVAGALALGASLMTMKQVLIPAAAVTALALVWSFNRSDSIESRAEDSIERKEQALAPVANTPEVETRQGARVASPPSPAEIAAPATSVETPSAGALTIDVEVLVLDLQSNPIADVPVTLKDAARKIPFESQAEESQVAAPDFGVTDANGRVEAVAERGAWSVLVETPDWTTISAGVIQSVGATATPTVIIGKPRLVAGVVKGSDGAPAAGVPVTYTSPLTPWMNMEQAIDHVGRAKFKTVTDEAGAFEFARVPELDQSMLIAGGDSAVTPVPRAEFEIDDRGSVWAELTLEEPALPVDAVTGTVVDETGVPVAGALVSLGAEACVSDAAGRFSLDPSLPMSTDTVRAALIGYQPAMQTKDEGGDWADPLVLQLGGVPLSISGVVERIEGAPVAGAKVKLVGTTFLGLIRNPRASNDHALTIATIESYLGGTDILVVDTDDRGRFRFDGLLAKDYSLVATSPVTLESIAVGAIGAGRDDVRIVLPNAEELQEVAGIIVDSRGAGIPGARLHLSRVMDVPSRQEERVQSDWEVEAERVQSDRVIADDEGRFAFEAIVGAELTLHAYAGPGYPFVRRELKDEVNVDELEIEVSRLATFYVQYASAKPGASSWFELIGSDGAVLSLFQAEGQGMFSMQRGFFSDDRSPVFSVPEGKHTIVVYEGTDEVARQEVELSPGDTHHVSF